MRLGGVILVAAAAVIGCPDSVRRVDATRPTVSYRVDSQREFEQATREADDWCYENYRARARLIETGYADDRDVVTFECV
jgi:hypothetical protein